MRRPKHRYEEVNEKQMEKDNLLDTVKQINSSSHRQERRTGTISRKLEMDSDSEDETESEARDRKIDRFEQRLEELRLDFETAGRLNVDSQWKRRLERKSFFDAHQRSPSCSRKQCPFSDSERPKYGKASSREEEHQEKMREKVEKQIAALKNVNSKINTELAQHGLNVSTEEMEVELYKT